MPIDPIGKAPPVPAPAGPEAARETGAEFHVGGASEAAPASDLGRLERGEIGLGAYLDARVADATRHLAGRLSAEQLETVKQTLRGELESDPVLVELVRRATGKMPEPAAS